MGIAVPTWRGVVGGASYRTLCGSLASGRPFRPGHRPKMHRTTGNEAYREEALEFVRAYQKVFPYWPWTYSLDALLEKDAATRSLAACRARYLDPGVRFPEARWPDAHGGFFCLQRRALEVNQVTAALDR